MKEIFVQKDIAHNLRNNLTMRIPKTRTSSYGLKACLLSVASCGITCAMNLNTLKLLHHLKGKLKDGMITATAGYAENSLVMSFSLIN